MDFSLDIRDPRNGWVEVRLSFLGQDFELAASDVANDPISELAQVAIFLLSEESAPRRATFWLEPEGYDLSAWRADGKTWLALRHSEDAFTTLFEPVETLLEAPVGSIVVARELLRSLKDARADLVAAHEHIREKSFRGWRYPFPDDLVNQISEALGSCQRTSASTTSPRST